VRLGALQAYRYADLQPRGYDRAVNVYAVPTTAGVVTVACLGAPAERQLCDSAASGLRLRGGVHAFPLGARAAFAAALGRVFTQLDAARSKPLARWRAAHTRATEASAASALAGAYDRARAKVARLQLSPGEQTVARRIAADLHAVSRALASTARAARNGNEAAYRRARASVQRRERALARTVKSLTSLGYQVG
jgi:hypothetical protein